MPVNARRSDGQVDVNPVLFHTPYDRLILILFVLAFFEV